ncbi:hypothetical protein BJ912DRAFT_47061 [Pholiota molesta]|nr:hypothetical protein BJ912DRAFT_47061 [Pholiota molesta]
MVLALEHHARGEKKALRNIQDSLTVLGDRVADAVVSAPHENVKAAQIDRAVVMENNEKVMEALKEVKERLAVDFPALSSKLEEMHKSQGMTGTNNEVAQASSSAAAQDFSTVSADLKLLLDRLEEIRVLCNSSKQGELNREGEAETTKHVEKILSLVQEDSNKQTLLSQQQADSVRYLNELNSWLEAFVNNGTSQIQSISANLDRLCQELGFNEQADGLQSQSGPQPNLVNDIRQLVAGMKARDQNFASLQAAVHSLLEVLTASQTQQGADSQAIASLMNRQRRDQELMFRAFTNEISGEIKGERLRFVEAMKEATAINVQLHVEQFKQELGREVMVMTEEVGRLHREKLNVENQISDLFSFYSKHKHGEQPLQTIQENAILPAPTRQVQDKSRLNLPRSHNHRLLPYPR